MRNFHNLFEQGTNRRTFLKGAGVSLLLPQFASVAGDKAVENPVRMAFLHVPNGKIMKHWKPASLGKNYQMPQTLKPLENLREHFQLVSGLQHHFANANGDGGGDHARSQGTFLTGVQVLKSVKKARAGISIDQVAANKIRNKTYLPSLELSTRKGRLSGACDSGYSCMYQFNLAWKSPTEPMVPESSAELAFNRLFTIKGKNNSSNQEQLRKTGKSVLDFMKESANSLERKLGREDTEKLRQYMESLREMERKANRKKPEVDSSQFTRNFSVEPENYKEKIETLMDLMVLAWEVDATRICTMIVADEGSNQSFPEMGIKGGHHTISHHRGKKENIEALEKIDHFYVSRLAYFLNKLNDRKVNGKSLLESSMVMYGSGISDGNSHRNDNLPILLAGHANGKLNPGYHREYKKKPLTNLFLNMLDVFGTPVNSFADSTGKLELV